MRVEAMGKNKIDVSFGPGCVWNDELEGKGEQALDQLLGEAILQGVRLQKVLRAREALLKGPQRELVLSFPRRVEEPEAMDC